MSEQVIHNGLACINCAPPDWAAFALVSCLALAAGLFFGGDSAPRPPRKWKGRR